MLEMSLPGGGAVAVASGLSDRGRQKGGLITKEI